MSKRMPVSLNTMVNLYVDPLMVQLQRIFTTYYLLKNQCSTEFGIKISQAGSYVLYQRSDGTISGAAQENTYRYERSSQSIHVVPSWLSS